MNISQNPDLLTNYLSLILISDSNLRTEAENQIKSFASQNLSQFLLLISEKLSDENEKKEIRQLSATLIKNII